MMIKKALARAGVATAAATLALLSAGSPAGAAAGAPWIGYGQTNTYNGVRCVQNLVNSLHWQTGYHVVAEDGVFGRDTYGAIKAFQQWSRLPDDGVVGPQTGTELLIQTKDGDGNGCAAHIPSRA